LAPTKWFKKAVRDRPPYTLGWKKTQSTPVRRQNSLDSRPNNWKLDTRRLSAARALTAIANVTKDKRTKLLAKRDARHFFNLARS